MNTTKCPNCGVEFELPPPDSGEDSEQLPLLCPECGAPQPDADFVDPFAAAMEQVCTAQKHQEQMRQRYGGTPEPHPEPPPVLNPVTIILPPDETETPDDPPKPDDTKKKKIRKKTKERCLIAAAVAVIFLLSAYAVHELSKGIPENEQRLEDEAAPVNPSYAVYECDNALRFFTTTGGESTLLSSIPERLRDVEIGKLVQVSPDGSRVYYPTAIDDNLNCLLEYRTLSEEGVMSDTAAACAAVSLQAWQNRCAELSSNINAAEYYVDMMPPYVVTLNNEVYYLDENNGLLCANDTYKNRRVAEHIVRWWAAPDQKSVYYLQTQMSGVNITFEKWSEDSSGKVKVLNSITKTYSEHGCYEEAQYPCMLGSSDVTEDQQWMWNAYSWSSWNLIEKDSPEYFYPVLKRSDDGQRELYQVDLRHPERLEVIIMSDLHDAVIPHILESYADGSCYYLAAGDIGIFVYYFRRAFDASYPVCRMNPSPDEDQPWDVCREEPYFLDLRKEDSPFFELYSEENAVGSDFSEIGGIEPDTTAKAKFADQGTAVVCTTFKNGKPFQCIAPLKKLSLYFKPLQGYSAFGQFFYVSGVHGSFYIDDDYVLHSSQRDDTYKGVYDAKIVNGMLLFEQNTGSSYDLYAYYSTREAAKLNTDPLLDARILPSADYYAIVGNPASPLDIRLEYCCWQDPYAENKIPPRVVAEKAYALYGCGLLPVKGSLTDVPNTVE